MKNLKAKLKKQGGFTLIEMLIVVAIIAILIAVSIPLVNSALERAREATDAANERSFKAVLTISYLNGKYETGTKGSATANFSTGTVYAFDAANGTLADTTGVSSIKGYGKSTKAMGADNKERKGMILCGVVDGDGVIRMQWGVQGSMVTNGRITGDNLISPNMVGDV